MSEGFGLIWTAMPIELVAEGLLPADPAPAPVEIRVEDRLLQVQPGADGSATICRLISPDPQDYLDPRWQPGASVNMPRQASAQGAT